jgi:hypothetical protein
MDWLNELPSISGIDRIVAEGAQKLMRGPVVFKSPYSGGYVVIETLDDYRAWIRTVVQVNNGPGGEQRVFPGTENGKEKKTGGGRNGIS